MKVPFCMNIQTPPLSLLHDIILPVSDSLILVMLPFVCAALVTLLGSALWMNSIPFIDVAVFIFLMDILVDSVS